MARGNPDFFGDSVYQNYGDITSYGDEVTLQANEEKVLYSALGKGELLGVAVRQKSGTNHYTDSPKLYLDDTVVAWRSWWDMYLNHSFYERAYPFRITEYNTVEETHSCCLSTVFTFNTGFSLVYKNTRPETIAVRYHVSFRKM